ncbi:MAG: septal ring lytic transglycosylase RlpA family protein [Pseudomonadota bacterium]
MSLFLMFAYKAREPCKSSCERYGSRASLLAPTLFILLLNACTSSEPRVAWEGDGAPKLSLRAKDVVDAVPRADPILRAGNTSPYEVNGVSYAVLSSAERYEEQGIASWYGTKFHGNKTANGEIYDLYLATAAHRSLPIPSYVRVENLNNGRDIIVRVNDRGPFHADRLIDLSYAAAVKLGIVEAGTAPVRVTAISLAGIDDQRAKEQGAYRYIQLGAFANPVAAESLRDSVAEIVDFPVTVTPVDMSGQRLSRVRVGPVADGAQLYRLRDMLLSRGFNPGLAMP